MALAFKIERNVPVPKRRVRNAKYPWADLKIGDSFFVPLDGQHSLEILQNSLLGCIRKSRNLKIEITTRIDKPNNGVRVWRTK